MKVSISDDAAPQRLHWPVVVGALLFAALLIFTFQDGLRRMLDNWQSPEYGHSYFIPAISGFLVWQKRLVVATLPWRASWAGFAVVAIGLALFFVGELSTLFVIVQYAFIIVIIGCVLAIFGWPVTKALWAPLLFLFFMVPLPDFLYNQASMRLQLFSSELGAAIIRALGISVFVEGNVIDLGVYKLQVVEACSGLRYLFPLMTIAFIAAYFYNAALWKRVVLFLSSFPIAILMNSFRIGVIGVLVEFAGSGAAEGFLHFFEGWVVFMLCVAILIGEMWLLARVGGDRRPLPDLFRIETEVPAATAPMATVAKSSPAVASRSRLSAPFVLSLIMLVASAAFEGAVQARQEPDQPRQPFGGFPLTMGSWHGRPETLDHVYLNALKLDDYALINYVNDGRQVINFYAAYYASQRAGQSAHSPRTCIPGGGWEIVTLKEKQIPPSSEGNDPLHVNRAVIQRGLDRQLVYYWFKQRDRIVTSEYLVKWYLLWDALTRNRTDGALIRLTTRVGPGDSIDAADAMLSAFARQVADQLPPFVPD